MFILLTILCWVAIISGSLAILLYVIGFVLAILGNYD